MQSYLGSSATIRAKLTHDGRADQYYAKVTDCPTLRRLFDIEIEKIYDLEVNVAQLPAPHGHFQRQSSNTLCGVDAGNRTPRGGPRSNLERDISVSPLGTESGKRCRDSGFDRPRHDRQRSRLRQRRRLRVSTRNLPMLGYRGRESVTVELTPVL